MKKTHIAALSLAALLICLVAGTAWAGQSTHYAINWQVLSGGGAPATGDGGISLNGSLGQTAIGPSTSTSFNLGAGYWLEKGPLIYLPIIVRNYR